MIRHFWGAELTHAPADPGQDHRGVGTLEPLWNLFDLTPEGRPMDWNEQLSYQCQRAGARYVGPDAMVLRGGSSSCSMARSWGWLRTAIR